LPFQELIPIAEEDATWNMLLFLIRNHLTGTPVAISTLASVAKSRTRRRMRRIHALIERGDIMTKSASETGKRFLLLPSEPLLESFIQYARKIKFLLAETFGLRPKTDSDEDFYSRRILLCRPDHSPAAPDRQPFSRQARNQVSTERRQLFFVDAEYVG